MSTDVDLLKRPYRRVFILDDRNWFESCRAQYDPKQDLVLTYDFGLKREIEAAGGVALYVDHLVDPAVMHANNFRVYEFFRTWYADARGADLLTWRGVPIGFTFRIRFWNEIVFLTRTYLCLQVAASVARDSMVVGTSQPALTDVLSDLGVSFDALDPPGQSTTPAYYFPIHRWMNEKLGRPGLRHRVASLVSASVSVLLTLWDRVQPKRWLKPLVFIQVYHPTKPVLARLQLERRVRVVVAELTREAMWCRRVLAWRPMGQYRSAAAIMLAEFKRRRAGRLELTTGLRITEAAYRVLDTCVRTHLAETLRVTDSIVRYTDRFPLSLALTASNLGVTAVVDAVAESRGVPRYLIINGLLGPEYLDEGKYATVINGYSTNIAGTYFAGMSNVVSLGDPRMDAYGPVSPRQIESGRPLSIAIGASGHDNIELNSYVAVEFDFIHDVLTACRHVTASGQPLEIVIKVRPNGYRDQYNAFAAEYFPDLPMRIIDQGSMASVFATSDVYVSIDSQTLFEASCMGVPVIYHRKSNETKFAPFDAKCELVTTSDVAGLISAIDDLAHGARRFAPFLDRRVMEAYVGPLDGLNTERNLAWIYDGLAGKAASL